MKYFRSGSEPSWLITWINWRQRSTNTALSLAHPRRLTNQPTSHSIQSNTNRPPSALPNPLSFLEHVASSGVSVIDLERWSTNSNRFSFIDIPLGLERRLLSPFPFLITSTPSLSWLGLTSHRRRVLDCLLTLCCTLNFHNSHQMKIRCQKFDDGPGITFPHLTYGTASFHFTSHIRYANNEYKYGHQAGGDL